MALERDTVIATALNLLDDVGLDSLTMRRLADALGVKAASLYWHFANKQALMDGMADALMAQVACQAPADRAANRGWRPCVAGISHEVRQALLARRDGARVYAGTYVVTDNVMRVAEAMMGPLREHGASNQLACWSTFSLLDFVLGFVMEEQAVPQDSELQSGLLVRREAFEALASRSYPHVLASMEAVFSLDFDARFSLGLDIFLAGLEAKMTETAAT